MSAKDTEGVDGASVDDLFPPKVLDGLKFNLFGIGRKDDEEPNGAFQPPKDSMTGKIVLITGASSGLGLESAKRLALAGATVVVTARSTEKMLRTVQFVRDHCRSSSSSGSFLNLAPVVKGIVLDLDDLESVRSFPDRYRDKLLGRSKILDLDEMEREALPPTTTKPIDVLMNNAGCGPRDEELVELTVDGFERVFQSCHLGHFVLTARLFEEGLLNRNDGNSEASKSDNDGPGGCTVINVSSVAHRSAVVEFGYGNDAEREKQAPRSENDYGFNFDGYNSALGMDSYGHGKLANVMFTKELQKRADLAAAAAAAATATTLGSSNSNDNDNNSHAKRWLTAVSLEPGGVASDIWRDMFGYDPRTFDERTSNGEALQQPVHQSLYKTLLSWFLYRTWTQVERGANAQVWLAYAAVVSKGKLIGGQHYDEFRNAIPAVEFAYREDSNTRLWELSEDLAGISFDLEAPPRAPVDVEV